MIKTKPSLRVSLVLACLFAATHAFSQDAKPKAARGAASTAAKAKPRSTYTGKAKLEQGFVVLPDGRKIAVPESVKSKLPGAGKMNEWPQTTGQADEGMTEVAAVADEMIAEEVSKREQLARVNPGALKGNVIKPGVAAKTRNPHNRSELTGKAKVKNGFVVLPDGRQFAVPADVKAKWPGMARGEEWPGINNKSDEAMVIQEGTMEVDVVADTAEADEEMGSKPGTLQANPGALKGKVIKGAAVEQPAQAPAATQPAKSKVAQ